MRVTTQKLRKMKRLGQRIPMITAYDYTSAQLLEAAGIRLILVGDTLGQVVLGYDSTLPVTMDDMIHHLKAVVRGTRAAHIVADLPFMSYQAEAAEAVRNAGRLVQAGAQSVKLEGGRPVVEKIRNIVAAGIPVMGHLGLTPQSVHQLGGYRIQGKTPEAAQRLIEDALALEEAGVWALVLELVPASLAATITARLNVPTIGIGSGPKCDGQVQVFHDMMGLFSDFKPKHSRRFVELGEFIKSATQEYVQQVQSGHFPTEKESYSSDPSRPTA